jgi:hypothetical protein
MCVSSLFEGESVFTANAPAVDLAALSEAHLHPEVFRMLSFVFGDPFVDLFATSESRQTTKFCSVLPTDSKIPGFVLLDSMKLVWSADGLYYAFPPPELLPRVVAKICQDRTKQILLIAPAHQCKDILWPLVIDNPILIIPLSWRIREASLFSQMVQIPSYNLLLGFYLANRVAPWSLTMCVTSSRNLPS